MKRWQDTPGRYVYRGFMGMSAILCLQMIRYLRRTYPTLREELDQERSYFAEALKRQNTSRP